MAQITPQMPQQIDATRDLTERDFVAHGWQSLETLLHECLNRLVIACGTYATQPLEQRVGQLESNLQAAYARIRELEKERTRKMERWTFVSCLFCSIAQAL